MLIELVEVVKEINYLRDKKIQYFLAKKIIQYKLRKDFFNKFNLNIPISYNMIQELLVIDSDLTNRLDRLYTLRDLMITDTPMVMSVISLIVYGDIEFHLEYYNYSIMVCARGKDNARWSIHISTYDKDENLKTITFHPTEKRLNMSDTSLTALRSIILMSIYNYCVLYVYEEDSFYNKRYNNLMMKNKLFIPKLEEIFREVGYIL